MSDWVPVESPVIWASRFPRSLDLVSFGWTCDGDKLEFVNAFRNKFLKVDEHHAPKALFFSGQSEVPAKVKDAFKVIDGLRIISPALKEVLEQFDMSGAQLFEVPIYADEHGAPSGLPNHYVLNVFGRKDAVIPELSENIARPILISRGETEPRPGTKLQPKNNLDVIALNAACGDSPDLWCDPDLLQTLFFSDRLKKAIDVAGLQTKALSFAPTRVFRQN